MALKIIETVANGKGVEALGYQHWLKNGMNKKMPYNSKLPQSHFAILNDINLNADFHFQPQKKVTPSKFCKSCLHFTISSDLSSSEI